LSGRHAWNAVAPVKSLAARLVRELAFPLTDTVTLIAMASFTLLTMLVREAGWLGLWLGVLLVPALWRYLLMLLEARAHGRSIPVVGIESFNPIDNFWSLTPLVLIALSIWGAVLLHRQVSPLAGQAFALVLIATLPASMAVLALTRSPFESLDPRAILRMMVACGPAYVLAPPSIALAGAIIGSLAAFGAPPILVVAASFYALFLVVTFTGSLLLERNVKFSISIPEPTAPDEQGANDRRQQVRRGVLTHAYGFFVRDNRTGAMAHIQDALSREAHDDEAWRWYLGEMFKWESKDGALMLGQRYLHRLLEEGRDVEAVKLMSRCLLADPRFRPLPDDRDAAHDLLERRGRSDLERAMDL
jgi:hypothetical protein